MYHIRVMEHERRRVSRHVFGGVVELIAEKPSAYIVAQTTELSRLGCFVRTSKLVPVKTPVSLKITYDGNEFNASGEVVYTLPERGMGIQFKATARNDEALLEEWLAQSIV